MHKEEEVVVEECKTRTAPGNSGEQEQAQERKDGGEARIFQKIKHHPVILQNGCRKR